MREHRKTYGELTDIQRLKADCRAQTRRYVRTGKLTRPESCPRCAGKGVRVDAHHEDYARPLEVEWLCRPCHLWRHREGRS